MTNPLQMILTVLKLLNDRYEIIKPKQTRCGRASLLPDERPMLDQLQQLANSVQLNLVEIDGKLVLFTCDGSLIGGPFSSVEIYRQKHPSGRIFKCHYIGKGLKVDEDEEVITQVYQVSEIFEEGQWYFQVRWRYESPGKRACDNGRWSDLWKLKKPTRRQATVSRILDTIPANSITADPDDVFNLFQQQYK